MITKDNTQVKTHTIYAKIGELTKCEYANQTELNNFTPVEEMHMSMTRPLGKNTTNGFVPFGPVEVSEPYLLISSAHWPDCVMTIYNGTIVDSIIIRVVTSNGKREVTILEHTFSDCSIVGLFTDETCATKVHFQYTSYQSDYYQYDGDGKKQGTHSVLFDLKKLGNAKPAGGEEGGESTESEGEDE